MASTDDLISQIERVLSKFPAIAASWPSSSYTEFHFKDTVGFAALRTECIALGNHIYGAEHHLAKNLKATLSHETLFHLKSAEGILRGTIEALKYGLLTELRTQILLDVKTDFIDAAVRALDGGGVQAAAVLASAVLEDSAKRLAEKRGLSNVLNQEFSVVVVELFKAHAITKATKTNLLGFKDLRNSAFHAEWKNVSAESVRHLLLFLPHFMEHHEV